MYSARQDVDEQANREKDRRTKETHLDGHPFCHQMVTSAPESEAARANRLREPRWSNFCQPRLTCCATPSDKPRRLWPFPLRLDRADTAEIGDGPAPDASLAQKLRSSKGFEDVCTEKQRSVS